MADQDPETRRGGPTRRPNVLRRAEGSDAMAAWEHFLTGGTPAGTPPPGDARAVAPSGAPSGAPPGEHVVASWTRSRAHGVDPTGRAAPLATRGDDLRALRERNRPLIEAARDIFARTADLLAGAHSIMVLTDPDGVVLHTVGDRATLGAAEAIHLVPGGAWPEEHIGTNGIGTAIATRRPAHVHAAEHFCEGIKDWTCAACPIFEPGTGQVLGVLDISGPPATFQRTNLTLAVAAARQIETASAERVAREHARLLQACVERLSARDVGGLVALDRSGRLVHAAGRVRPPVRVGERLPGLHERMEVEDWAKLLPREWRAEWFNPVSVAGDTIGAVLVVPDDAPRGPAPRAPLEPPPPERLSPERPPQADPGRGCFERIVGRSPAMLATIGRARALVDKRVSVLIEGETGTGKELLARAIHGGGDARRPFVVFNCGAVTRDLVAAELFGHVRGAFTGATSEGRPGRFELAHGGTLCLDEIGEMPLEVQPFLLRALEEGVIYRLGDARPRRVDVRLVAMTNRDLPEEVGAGRFRRDLYYRIGVARLRVPPLRDRGGDVLLLAEHFNRALSARHGVPPLRLAPGAQAALLDHAWPGNAREVRNLVESLLLMSPGEVGPDDVAPLLAAGAPLAPAPIPMPGPACSPPISSPRPITLEGAERDAIVSALALARGNVVAASRALGISRSTLYRKAERYGLRA